MKKIVSVLVITTFVAASCGFIPKKAEKNGIRIEYTKDVPKEDLDKLLDYLAKNNEDGSTKDFKLSKEGDGYRIKMVVRSGFEADEKNVELMTDFSCEISKEVFGGKMVNLDLCDEYFKLKKAVKSENCDQFETLDKEMRNFGKIELYYGKDITEKQQDEVGKYLVDYFGDRKRITFAIDKKDGEGILSIVISKEKYYTDAETLNDFRIMACDMGKIMGYRTVVHMCDDYMKMKKVVEPEKCN